jgi:hypothetical protein
MIQQWQTATPTYLELHGLFRLLNTSPRAALHGYAAGFLLSEYDIIIVPSMAEEPMANMPQAIPVSRYQLV